METIEIIKKKHENQVVDYLNQLIRYCRMLEKEYKEGDGKISGISALIELLAQGLIKMDLFLNILKAVKNYSTPYKITVQSK